MDPATEKDGKGMDPLMGVARRPTRRCPVCCGASTVITAGGRVQCSRCEGRGYVVETRAMTLARVIGERWREERRVAG